MLIKSLKLVNWRNYQEASFNFMPGANVLVGRNAAGKTNVLEALVMLAIVRSFRTKKDRSLVNQSAEFAKVVGNFENEDGDWEEEIRLVTDRTNRWRKELRLQGVSQRILNVIGKLRVVYFSPEEIERFYGSPERRRRWMDVALAQVDSTYAYWLSMYKRVVVNRNKVLKRIAENRGGLEELAVWDEKLLEYAVPIIISRRELMLSVGKVLGGYFSDLFTGPAQLEVKYRQSTLAKDIRDGLKEELERYYNNEMRTGNTVVGPHREDVLMKLDGVELAEWGSRAQMRLALLSLKLAELNFIKEKKGEAVLLLDDIFSELDEGNKKQVYDFISQQQTIITATDMSGIEINDGNIINVG